MKNDEDIKMINLYKEVIIRKTLKENVDIMDLYKKMINHELVNYYAIQSIKLIDNTYFEITYVGDKNILE